MKEIDLSEIDKLAIAAKSLSDKFTSNPSFVTSGQIESLAIKNYEYFIKILDAKEAQGYAPSDVEKNIYNICKEAVGSSTDGLYSALFSSIEVVRSAIEQVLNLVGLDNEQDAVYKKLSKEGNDLLPNYATIIEGLFVTIDNLLDPIPFMPSLAGITSGQYACASKYQRSGDVNKTNAAIMLELAKFAYGDTGSSGINTGYTKLAKEEVPESIRALYDPVTGLLSASRGLIAWLGKNKNGEYAVAFSGTDLTYTSMVYADVLQLSAPSVLYLRAAGLLKIMIEEYSDAKFNVAGHSLGGGLTQFALTANIANHPNMCGYCYNPAGLSSMSLIHLGDDRLSKAKECVWVFSTCYDLVSIIGGKIGILTVLPKTTNNGHGVADLSECMKEYTKDTTVSANYATQTKVECNIFKHPNQSDTTPNTYKLSIFTQTNGFNPIFITKDDGVKTLDQTFKLPGDLFKHLLYYNKPNLSTLAITKDFSGTPYNIANILYLLSTRKSPDITLDIALSVVNYGLYGLSIERIVNYINIMYIESGELFITSRSDYDLIMAQIRTPFTAERNSFMLLAKHLFDIDFSAIFSEHVGIEEIFDETIRRYVSRRLDLYTIAYDNRFSGLSNLKTLYIKFINDVKSLLINQINSFHSQCSDKNIITDETINAILDHVNQNYKDHISNIENEPDIFDL